jgi:hypothetical protein
VSNGQDSGSLRSKPSAAESGAHEPCCSSHGVDMSCERYRRTHFVEVRPCCSADARLLAQEEGRRCRVSTDEIGESAFCHCGKSIDDVSLPHYLSCAPDSGFTEEEAEGMVARIVTRVEDGIA